MISPTERHYYVDEGGDSTLFSSKGKILIGTEGCSRFFILGLLDVENPAKLEIDILEKRKGILTDPYYKNVPSMQVEEKKTALTFHAKDDLPEVRREVFYLLRHTHGLRFFAVVADKWRVLEYVRQQNERDSQYRYHPNELYDYLTRRLFKNLLHQYSGYEIVFSKRGNSDRTTALHLALESARKRFSGQWNIESSIPMKVIAGSPAHHAGLQAVDYFTWSLQRLYERGEDRFIEYLWPAFRMVQDINDDREKGYGVYYTQKKPLTKAALNWRTI